MRRVSVMCVAGAAIGVAISGIVGCEKRQDAAGVGGSVDGGNAAKATEKGVSVGSTVAIQPKRVETTVSAPVRDFQAQLREVTATTRRVFATGQDGYARSETGPSLSITVGLRDMIGSRVFRVREGSMIRSVLDDGGRELLQSGEGILRGESGGYGKAEFGAGMERAQVSTQVVRLTIPRMPEALQKVSGEYRLELVSEDLEKTIELPEVEKPVEIAPGMTVVVKMLDVPPEPVTTGPTQPVSVPGARVSVEIRSGAGTAERPAPAVQTVELLDGAGGVVAVLTRREESTVGEVLRRRFSNTTEGGYAASRPERPSAKQPKSLRFRVLTHIETVVVPFEFGVIDLRGENVR